MKYFVFACGILLTFQFPAVAKIRNSETLHVTQNGWIAYVLSRSPEKVQVENFLVEKKSEISIADQPLIAFASSSGAALIIAKSGGIWTCQFTEKPEKAFDLSQQGFAALAGSLSRSNELFYVGMVRWPKGDAVRVNYNIFKIDHRFSHIEKLGDFESKNVGVIVRFKKQLWLLSQGESELLAIEIP